MMRLNISQVVDGVNFHAEVDGIEEAKTYLAFLNSMSKAALSNTFNLAEILPPPEPTSLAGVEYAEKTLVPLSTGGYVVHTPSEVKAEAKGEKWTRENLQSVVVALVTSKRDEFAALLKANGVSRFRDLPDDKLNDFGVACAGLQGVAA